MESKFKILLATDYSSSVESAEEFAVQFARTTNSELVMLHVFEHYSSDEEKTSAHSEKYMRDEISEQENNVQLHSFDLLTSFQYTADDVNIKSITREGSASKEIVKETERAKADFIVVGTHGETGFINRIFGNHTWEVINNANVPVIVVPQYAKFSKWKNIVFATEYREGEMPVINFLSQLAKMFDAELTILHISNYSLLKELEIVLFDTFHKEVIQSISYSKLSFRMLRDYEVTEGLNRFCMDHQVDLLVISPQKQELFEKIFSPEPSITKRMTFQAKIPLMTIPDFYHPGNERFWKIFDEYRHLNLLDK